MWMNAPIFIIHAQEHKSYSKPVQKLFTYTLYFKKEACKHAHFRISI